MSSGTYTEPLNYATNFNVPLLIHIVVCSSGLKAKTMRTEKEIKARISDIKETIDDINKDLDSELRLTIEDENEMIADIANLKMRIGILEWVLNENGK